jgi:DNA-binding transcriptional LysR family regulator
VAVETNSAALSLAYVRAGLGVGITTGHRRGFLGVGLGLRPVGDWFGAARYVFVRLRGAYLPPAQGRLIDLIREAARDDPPARHGVR